MSSMKYVFTCSRLFYYIIISFLATHVRVSIIWLACDIVLEFNLAWCFNSNWEIGSAFTFSKRLLLSIPHRMPISSAPKSRKVIGCFWKLFLLDSVCSLLKVSSDVNLSSLMGVILLLIYFLKYKCSRCVFQNKKLFFSHITYRARENGKYFSFNFRFICTIHFGGSNGTQVHFLVTKA